MAIAQPSFFLSHRGLQVQAIKTREKKLSKIEKQSKKINLFTLQLVY